MSRKDFDFKGYNTEDDFMFDEDEPVSLDGENEESGDFIFGKDEPVSLEEMDEIEEDFLFGEDRKKSQRAEEKFYHREYDDGDLDDNYDDDYDSDDDYDTEEDYDDDDFMEEPYRGALQNSDEAAKRTKAWLFLWQ